MRVMLASGNRDKVAELTRLLPGASVEGAPEGFDPEETGTSLLQNAWIKAAALRGSAPADALVLADDSGLEVRALGGRPGIFSARYAGPGATYLDNCRRLLDELDGREDRRAAFVCVLVGLDGAGGMLVAGGCCPGTIAHAPRGEGGFGYDPLFVPADDGGQSRMGLRPTGDRELLRSASRTPDRRTMAEMSPAEKAAVSHRGRAARRLGSLLGLAVS